MPAPMFNSVGIANLPNQLHKIVSKKGGKYTIMVVGESGLGKTTFVNTLFTSSLLEGKKYDQRFESTESGVKMNLIRAQVEEKNFRVDLTVIDAQGFGDFVDNTEGYVPIMKFLQNQHEFYLRQESKPNRSKAIVDLRVHALVYFISPHYPTLRPLDIRALTALCPLVNIIPVIAKADTLSSSALMQLKDNVRQCIAHYNIQVYACPLDTDDEDSKKRNISVLSAMPFGVIGGSEVTTNDGRKVIGRKYPWGLVEVENEEHCDFKKLRTLLIRAHMNDLIETTHDIHYENYRQNRFSDSDGSINRDQFESHLKHEDEKFRARLAQKVQIEEVRFRQWEAKLVSERDRLMKNLESEHAALKQLLAEVEQLEVANDSDQTSAHSGNTAGGIGRKKSTAK
ncbi:hypothetical protein MP228_011197 [Amoeboaphelidium protococcarum]|nr:hypothetical protein MP228_011197 [Amoeboaphelidium protococcarum]